MAAGGQAAVDRYCVSNQHFGGHDLDDRGGTQGPPSRPPRTLLRPSVPTGSAPRAPTLTRGRVPATGKRRGASQGRLCGPSELTGGNDVLDGGDGADLLYGDGTASAGGSMVLLIGGDDVLTGGKGNDTLWGDGTITSGSDPVLDGGADTFVFGSRDGLDTVADFRVVDGDVVDLSATGIVWGDLDSNADSVLDIADDLVRDLGALHLDLGAATGGAANRNVVTFTDLVALGEADVLFT